MHPLSGAHGKNQLVHCSVWIRTLPNIQQNQTKSFHLKLIRSVSAFKCHPQMRTHQLQTMNQQMKFSHHVDKLLLLLSKNDWISLIFNWLWKVSGICVCAWATYVACVRACVYACQCERLPSFIFHPSIYLSVHSPIRPVGPKSFKLKLTYIKLNLQT